MTLVIFCSQPVIAENGSNTTQDWILVWNDECNGTNGSPVDSTKWGFDTGDGSDRGIPGWGNNELEYYTDRLVNSYQEDGCLVIKAQQENYEGKSYTSARLITKNKADWKYGRFEIKAKLPYGKGIWPAIWALPTDNVYGAWPDSGEIDVMEEVGQVPSKVYGTAHWGNPYQKSGSNYSLSEGSFSDDFHIFSLEWDPGQIRWYVDGKQYHSVDMSKPFDKKFYLLLNIAVGGNWPGSPDDTTTFPQVMKVDYVRIYQRGTTPSSVQEELTDFITEKQLQYVRRSYGTGAGQCFTDYNLEVFKTNFVSIKEEIEGDCRLDTITEKAKGLSFADRQVLYNNSLKIYTPTWTELGYIDSTGKGQTGAGQEAEKMIGAAIVNMVKNVADPILPGVWDTKTTNDPLKTWTVKFNMPIIESNLNENIYVTDDNNNIISTNISMLVDGKSIAITPVDKYRTGVEYRLYITKNICSSNGINLKNAVVMPFLVQ